VPTFPKFTDRSLDSRSNADCQFSAAQVSLTWRTTYGEQLPLAASVALPPYRVRHVLPQTQKIDVASRFEAYVLGNVFDDQGLRKF
jgi:hypothetical protein